MTALPVCWNVIVVASFTSSVSLRKTNTLLICLRSQNNNEAFSVVKGNHNYYQLPSRQTYFVYSMDLDLFSFQSN